MRYCTPRGAARSLIVRDDSPGVCTRTVCAWHAAWACAREQDRGHGRWQRMCPRSSLGEGATCQGLQIVRQASPRRACTRLTASAAAMVSSTTSSGGTHGGNRCAASAGASDVSLSARAMSASDRQAKTSACHLYSGQMREPSATRRRGMVKRSPLSCSAKCGASTSAVRCGLPFANPMSVDSSPAKKA